MQYSQESCKAATLLEADSNTGVFSSEYCKVFKNTYFEEHLLTAAFDFLKKATEHWWAATSVLTFLLSLDNLTG